MLIRILIIEN